MASQVAEFTEGWSVHGVNFKDSDESGSLLFVILKHILWFLISTQT